MGGKSGSSAPNVTSTPGSLTQANNSLATLNDPRIQQALQAYGSGGQSLADVLGSLNGQSYVKDQGSYKNDSSFVNSIKQQMAANPNIKNASDLLYDPSSNSGFNVDGMSPAHSAFGNSLGAGDFQALANDKESIQDYLQGAENKVASDQGDLGADFGHQFEQQLATDPTTAMKYAQDKLSDNQMYKTGLDTYNKDNAYQTQLQGNIAQDRDALSGKDPSYGLTDQDYAAYGQASGQIANQYGSQENSLAQSLADRGLGAAGSGAAGAQFTTLQGNKNEALAQAQMQIAQNRIQTAQQNLQARSNLDQNMYGTNSNQMLGLGQLGQKALEDQYSSQVGGKQLQDTESNNNILQNQQQQGLNQGEANSQFEQNQQSQQPSMLGTVLGTVAGGAAGAFTGGVGTGAGSAVGSALGKALSGSGSS